MKHFDSSIPDRVPYKQMERYTPSGSPLENVGAILLLSSGVVALTLLLGLLICVSMGWPLKVVPCGGAVALGVLWMVLLAKYDQWPRLFYSVEKIVGHDLDGDGEVGQPQITHFSLPAGPHTLQMGEYAVDPPLLMDWCRAAANNQSLAYASWETRFGGREEYAAFRDWLVAQGFAEEAGGNIGFRIRRSNPEAVAFIAGFAQMQPEDGQLLIEGE